MIEDIGDALYDLTLLAKTGNPMRICNRDYIHDTHDCMFLQRSCMDNMNITNEFYRSTNPMGRFKRTNFYTIFGWMSQDLGLKGSEKEVYAMVYCFTLNSEDTRPISLQYIMEGTSNSKPTVISALNKLTEKGYIIREDKGYNTPEYRYNPAAIKFLEDDEDVQKVVKKFNHSGKENEPEMVKKFDQDGKEILPHINNINKTKGNINKGKTRTSVPVSKNPPTFEEFEAYIKEKNLNVDAHYQYEQWEASDWKDYFGNEMYSWKGQLITKSHNNDKKKSSVHDMRTETEDKQLDDIRRWQEDKEKDGNMPF